MVGIFQSNGLKKQAGVAILISNKIDFTLSQSKEAEKNTSYSSQEKSNKTKSQF